MASVAKVKEDTEKMKGLLKFQATNGSFEFTEALCKYIGVPFADCNKEMGERHFKTNGWGTALAMEYIDAKLDPQVKRDYIKEFDKAKLFLFKRWADSQPYMKKAAIARFGIMGPGQGVDGDGRPIVADQAKTKP